MQRPFEIQRVGDDGTEADSFYISLSDHDSKTEIWKLSIDEQEKYCVEQCFAKMVVVTRELVGQAPGAATERA